MNYGYMYILECSNGSYYTGSTKDLEFRIKQHQAGKGANHTKKHLPIKLVYFEEFQRIDEAFYREKQVQGWSRKKKEALINGEYGKLPDLSKAYRDLATSSSTTASRASASKTVSQVSKKEQENLMVSEVLEDTIPNGWVKTTLGEVCDTKGGKRLPKGETLILEKTDHPYIRITDFNGNSVNKNNLQFVPDKTFEKISRYIVNENDVIISIVGTIGLVARIDKMLNNASLTENCVKLINLKGVNNNFLFYYLTSSIGQYEINKNTVGAVQKKLPIYGVQNTNIVLPPLPEQKAIAKILTAFDDKIENLQAQNKTLETSAQTIFKEWFGKYQIGDELPDGWRVGKIGELIEIKRGGSPRPIKDFISDNGYRWLKISDATATNSPFIFNIKEHIKVEGLKKTTLKKAGDLVLSNSATPGLPKFLAIDTCVHDGWMHFPSSKVSNEYLYLLFLHIRSRLLQQGSGSVFVNLKTDILRYFDILIPFEQFFIDFDKIIKPIFNKIYNNATQIQTLKKTRDTLLPKLMIGQLRVKNV